MSDGYLSIEHGRVRLGNQLVPGTLVSMEIDGAVRFDSAEVDNLSGSKKTPLGWDDSIIRLEILLGSDDESNCYEKLSQLNQIFKGIDNNANPNIYNMANSHAIARGVDQVVFKALKSSESNQDDVIYASLAFDEHNPPTIPPEIRASGQKTTAENSTPQVQNDAVVDAAVTEDPDMPFSQGFNQGVS